MTSHSGILFLGGTLFDDSTISRNPGAALIVGEYVNNKTRRNDS